MKKISFSININASKQKVWEVLWGDDSYGEWTSVFSEGSAVDTNWKEGGRVVFFDASGSGMAGRIVKKIPNEFMSFQHLAEVKNGEEQPLNEETKKWSGALENYTLTDSGNGTQLVVDMDITEEHESIFNEKLPLALQKVKELAEG